MLSERYQTEQRELDDKIRKLTEEMDATLQTTQDAEKWIALIKQCSNPTELTAELLNTLIEKIVVHEAVKGTDGSRTISLSKGKWYSSTGLIEPAID